MRKRILILLPFLLLAVSCMREILPVQFRLPEGAPVTLKLDFGTDLPLDVQVGTKAEASRADESHVHDLYVLIFDNDDENGKKFYGRYFSYEQQVSTLRKLEDANKECWFVANKTISGVTPAISQTRGAVKISTQAHEHCTLVVLANISNALTSLDGEDPVTRLNEVTHFDELKGIQVVLEQETVNRENLFLMLGTKAVDTTNPNMKWGELDGSDNPTYYDGTGGTDDFNVTLTPLDAKVKFRIKIDKTFIDEIRPRYWNVNQAPSACFLYPGQPDPDGIGYFNTDNAYFEGEEAVDGDPSVMWQVFSFYMLENRQLPVASAASYNDRERQEKVPDNKNYGDGRSDYVKNTDWLFANPNSTFVKFDVVLTLNDAGIAQMGENVAYALTSDAVFTVHLGDFTGSGLDNYETLRGNFYTYDITVQNTTSIYIEVRGDKVDGKDQENQPAQEGSLLLTDNSIINCDAHYEYRSMDFVYKDMWGEPDVLPEGQTRWETRKRLSWYIKTPFWEGRPELDMQTGTYQVTDTGTDYLWVKFSLNEMEQHADGQDYYKVIRAKFPGNSEYDPDWVPDNNPPGLIDLNQLVNFLFFQNTEKLNGRTNLFDPSGHIRMTAFVDEYYYETNPKTGQYDPDLWRTFVNATPRELHILSDAAYSQDHKSDVIRSSHSIIQQSIQTFYNSFAPGLESAWGTEHIDEMRLMVENGMPWGSPTPLSGRTINDKNNGRLNTAGLWQLDPDPGEGNRPQWDTYLNYTVINEEPELQDDYKQMAYSCMTRNRDNDGDGEIDPDEVRWYLASINQLVGMWVGNDALSSTARIYQPAEGQWRAHVVSSTCLSNANDPRVLTSEEGSSTYNYRDFWAWSGSDAEIEANKAESVRCLRNLGSYDNRTRDITAAPFRQAVDMYYERTDFADNHYEISFRRLNPKCLRDYTDKELPFHNEKSLNNRPYLKLVTQSKNVTVIPDGSRDASQYPDDAVNIAANGTRTRLADMGKMNERVTSLGYNPFCPPGYRFPNQIELSIMGMVLDGNNSVTGQRINYWGSGTPVRVPGRTFYSRGKYGDDPTGSDLDKTKTGFTFSDQMRLPYQNQESTTFRCVRDEDLSGTIVGTMKLEKDAYCPLEKAKVKLLFNSTASAFSYASLKMYYTSASGEYREREIELDELPTGNIYQATQEFTVPGIQTFGINFLPAAITVQLTLRNAGGRTEVFSTQFNLNSYLHGGLDILDQFDPARGFPIRVTANSSVTSSKAKSYTVRWRNLDDASDAGEEEVTIAQPAQEYSEIYYWQPDWLSGDTPMANLRYSFDVILENENEKVLLDNPQTMEFVKVHYDPNPGAWTAANKPQAKWTAEALTNLNFSAGDFLDSYMDVSNCYYQMRGSTPNATNDLGMDNLFTIGPTSNIEWNGAAIFMYYPAHDNASGIDRLQISARGSETNRVQPCELTAGVLWLCLRRDQTLGRGVFLIGNGDGFNEEPDWTNDIRGNGEVNAQSTLTKLNDLMTRSTLYIGSTEGQHRSRAKYLYVRVVRKH